MSEKEIEEITEAEMKKLKQDKTHAIQEKERVQAETSQLKVDQKKIKELLSKELDEVKDSIEMFKKDEEAQKVKVNAVATEVKEAKDNLKALKDDALKVVQKNKEYALSYKNTGDAVISDFQNKIEELKKQEVLWIKSNEGLSVDVESSKKRLFISQEKEKENAIALEISSSKIDALDESVQILQEEKDSLARDISSQLLILDETKRSVKFSNAELLKISDELSIKTDELNEASKEVDVLAAQVITNQARAEYLKDWYNQIRVKERVNTKEGKKLKKREKALKEANA